MMRSAKKQANGAVVSNGHAISPKPDQKTDYTRWRLLDEHGRHTWHYLKSDEELKSWPQSCADKHFLGLPTGLPSLSPASKPSEVIDNALQFYSKLQLPPGNWACEYSGPHFLLPGIVFTWFVTNTPIPPEYAIEIKNYIFARQNRKDGGWGLHIEGHSSVFGTVMYYVVLRILGASAEDPRVIKARGKLHQMGGAICGPHWSKFWLSVLGLMSWETVNPCPPELWLLPDWVPIAPWRWWIHMRQVFLPMSFIWSRRWTYPETPFIRELRQEIYADSYDTIKFSSHRNTIASEDNYHPKTWILTLIMLFLAALWTPYMRTASLIEKAENWVWRLIQYEGSNTDHADLAPVSAPMNAVCSFIKEGSDSYSFQRRLYHLHDYMWINSEGMMTNGTNGVQVWDTAFSIQAVHEAGLAEDPKWKPMLTKALEYLEHEQIIDEVEDREKCYRQSRKGAWPFSTKVQGYTVSDCTAEGMRAVLMLQNMHHYKTVISEQRLQDAIDVLLTMQNQKSGGFSSYEIQRGSELLEYLNAAEVFGRIMVEYDYPECTTAVVTVLSLFQQFSDYRGAEIKKIKARALDYIRRAQREDGSWYGSWGICFAYGGMFALESLSSVGETYTTSERVRRACKFFVDRQMADGGWGESYASSEQKRYIQHEKSQVVNTAWTCIALLYAEYPDKEPIRRGLQMMLKRQQANGEWLQEAIEGVFNCSAMITYPNYKFYFPIKAFGMYKRVFGDEDLL